MRTPVLFAALAATAGADYDEGAVSGQYEEYVFALQWQPQWIAGSDCVENIAENLASSLASTHLSAHGLWPNYNASAHNDLDWPQFCVRADGEDYTTCDGAYDSESYCSPSDSALATFNNSEHWGKYGLEYAYSDLATHEWSKHGSCTNWTSEEYFAQVESMWVRMVNGSGGALVAANVGGSVTFEDLNSAFTADLDGKTLALRCTSCALSEVWTAWKADPATLIPTDPIDTNDDESCSSCSAISIPAWTADSCDSSDDGSSSDDTDVDTCVADTLGPSCDYDESTAGTASDPCLEYSNCVRCAKTTHNGVHHCTDQS